MFPLKILCPRGSVLLAYICPIFSQNWRVHYCIVTVHCAIQFQYRYLCNFYFERHLHILNIHELE
jgi:hypothetical protein